MQPFDLPSQPNVAQDPTRATREALPSAAARVRAAKDRLHDAHQAVQLANDMESIRATARALSHANNMLILAAQAAEDETRQAALERLTA